MRRCNQVVGILLLILSIWVIAASQELVYTVEFSPGAGFFPFWLGISLLVLSSLLLIYNTVLKSGGQKDNPLPGKKALLRVFMILGSLFVSMLFFERIGFLVSMGLLVVFLLIFLERYRWYSAVIISALMVFAIFGIFKIWLDVPLPLGILH